MACSEHRKRMEVCNYVPMHCWEAALPLPRLLEMGVHGERDILRLGPSPSSPGVPPPAPP